MHSNNPPPIQSSSNSDPFTIATRTVTTILPMAGNLNDTSFLQPSTPYQQNLSQVKQESLDTQVGTEQTQQQPPGHIVRAENSIEKCTTTAVPTDISKDPDTMTNDCSENPSNPQDDSSKGKKRNKFNKKNGKLDARSKLEKSRQSARECRARKKLRYQYLEDLVCNREKAVVKLREELAMFCELSKRIDSSTINDADRKLLLDQNTDSNKS